MQMKRSDPRFNVLKIKGFFYNSLLWCFTRDTTPGRLPVPAALRLEMGRAVFLRVMGRRAAFASR